MNDHLDERADEVALRLLPADEMGRAEAHMARCEACRTLVGEYESIAHLLLATAPEVEPRACLEERVMAAYTAAVEQERLDLARAPRPVVASPARRTWLRGVLAPAPVLAAVLVLAVAGLVAWGLALNNRVSERDDTIARQQVVLETLAAGGSLVRLAPADPEVSAEMALVLPTGGVSPTLVVRDAPPLPDGRVYQVWLLRGSTPVSAGVFTPTEGVQSVPLEVNASGYDTVALTDEPPGGSPAPTGQIAFSAALQPGS